MVETVAFCFLLLLFFFVRVQGGSEKKIRNAYKDLKIKDWSVEKNLLGRYTLFGGAPNDIREEWRKKTERLRRAETALKEAERRLYVYNSIDSEVSYLKEKAGKTLEEKTADVEAQADGMWDLRIRYGNEAWCDFIDVDGKSDSRKPSHGTTFLCMLEPVIGDDFPVVIRQVKDNIKCMFERTLSTSMHVKPAWKSDIWDGSNWEQEMDRRERGCETIVLVIYREFRASGISEADMKAVFRSAGIYAISETEYLTTHRSIYKYTCKDNKHVDAENPFFTMFTLTDRVTYSAPVPVSAENPDSMPAVEYDYRAVFEKERILGRILTDSELQEFVLRK